MAAVVASWHHQFIADNAESCDLLTLDAQAQLARATNLPDCPKAAAELLLLFTAADRAGFESVDVDPDTITIKEDRATVAAGGIQYPKGTTEDLRLTADLPLERQRGSWLIASVIQTDQR